ncbi:MAG: gluconate 2-dehydrogenase subunit 3 family protein, partial [Gemmatimonadota bacterium]|nr:gluconate 2-dehydrogenase subunit 3 family protein [Gemmatimonadota bacterium]
RAEELAPARDEGDGGEPAAREEPLPPFALLKEWTLVGYYTSEVGATQELRWLANPGRYAADMPLDEVGRAWA